MNIINSLEIQNENFYYYDLTYVYYKYEKLKELPIVLKILLETNLRKSKNDEEFENVIKIFLARVPVKIKLNPSRIIMQEYVGLPTLVDLASMRSIYQFNKAKLVKINPQITIDLILDSSLCKTSKNEINTLEASEKYTFVKWALNTFKNLRVIPPGSGICHQVNLEYLSTIIHLERKDNKNFIYPETALGTNPHHSLPSSLGVLSYGIKPLEAEAIILGKEFTMALPYVVGINITGKLNKGLSSCDLLESLKNLLKMHSLSGKIIEFYGESLEYLNLEDRVIIANISSEYGVICSFFPIDDKTIYYYNKTRDNKFFGEIIKLYLKRQDMYYSNSHKSYDETIYFDLNNVNILIKDERKYYTLENFANNEIKREGSILKDYDIILANIYSTFEKSNPYSLIHSALLAKKAISLGLIINKNIKRTLLLSSQASKEYLEKLDLLKYFIYLGFEIIDLENEKASFHFNEEIKNEVLVKSLNIVSLSNMNEDLPSSCHFINSNYTISSSLLLAFCLKGNTASNILEDYLQKDIKLEDIWPKREDVVEYLNKLDTSVYKNIYKNIFLGNTFWQNIKVSESLVYKWNNDSTYIQRNDLFKRQDFTKLNIKNAQILNILGNDVKSEQISPFGQISLYSQAGLYLESKGLKSYEYNTFISRRTNSKVMLRGMFDNAQIKNKMVLKEGAFTKDFTSNEIISIYAKSLLAKKNKHDLVILAQHNYGSGKYQDWAVKGTKLLGVKVIIALSFDEEHRKNLIKMGILPCEFTPRDALGLDLQGNEVMNISFYSDLGINDKINLEVSVEGKTYKTKVLSRIDTKEELNYYTSAGMLNYYLNKMIDKDL